MMKVVEKYKKENKHSMENINIKQKKGLKSLQTRQINGEIVVYSTDKSGRLSVDSVENYIEAARPHVENDDIIEQEDYSNWENNK